MQIRYSPGISGSFSRPVGEAAVAWLTANGYEYVGSGKYSKQSRVERAGEILGSSGAETASPVEYYPDVLGLDPWDTDFVEKVAICDALAANGIEESDIKEAAQNLSLEELNAFLESGLTWSEWQAMNSAESGSTGNWKFPGWISMALEFALEWGIKAAISGASGGALAALAGPISAALAGALIFVIVYIAEAISNGTSINFVELLVGALVSALIAVVADFAIGKVVDKLGPALKSGFDSLSTKIDELITVATKNVKDGLEKVSSTFKTVGNKIDNVIKRIKAKFFNYSDLTGRKLFKSSYDIPVDPKTGYTKSNLTLGRNVHSEYYSNMVGKGKEFTLPSGKRVDYIDFESGIVYELKPNNPNGVSSGKKQLQGYTDELNKMAKEFPGSEWDKNWSGILDTY